MSDHEKTKTQLIAELKQLRKRAAAFESTTPSPPQFRSDITEAFIGQQLIDALVDTVFIFDPATGKPLRWNKAFTRASGYTDAEIASMKAPDDWYDEEDLKRAAAAIHSIQQGEQATFEASLITKEGRAVPFEYKATLLWDDANENQHIVAIGRDITERKQTELMLARERDVLSRVMETSPVAITIINKDGQITFANQRAETILGLKKETITQRTYNAPSWNITDFDGEPFPEEDLPFVQVMTTGQAVYDVQHAIEWADGKRTVLSINAGPLYGGSGDVDNVVATITDITHRTYVDQTLRFVAQQEWTSSELEYHQALVKYLGELLRVDYVYIAKLSEDEEIIHTDAIYEKGQIIENVTYDLEHTPCQNVIGKKLCVYPDNVQELFPEDELLVELGIHSYAGIPMWDSDRKPLGIIAILDSKPFIHPDLVKSLLQIVVDRTAYEIERERNEQQLRNSEARLRAIFENSVDAIGVSQAGIQLDANPAYLQLFGYDSVDQIEDRLITNLIAPYERERINRYIIQREQGSDTPTRYEARGIRQDGTEFDLSVTVSTYMLEEEMYTIAMLRDITDRKQAEEALQKSEERYRAVVESQTEFVVRSKPDGTRTFVNQAYCRYFGVTSEEAIGTNFFDLVPESYHDQIREKYSRLTPDNPTETDIHQSIASDGSLRWQEWTETGIFNEQGDIVEIQAIGRDITEQRLAQELLWNSEVRNQAILEAIPDMMFRLSREGIHLDFHAPAPEQLFINPDEFIGKSVSEVLPEDVAHKYIEAIHRVMTTSHMQVFEYQLDFGEGDRRSYEARMVLSGQDEVLAIVREDTERKKAEAELIHHREHLEELVEERTKHLREANRQLALLGQVKDEFVSNVSHELRSPITSLKLRLHILGKEPDRISHYLPTLQRETERLHQTIESLLNISRLDQAQVELNREVVDLNDLITGYVDDRQLLAEEQGITLSAAPYPEIVPLVADGDLLGQVLGILLTNAINYTPEGGSVVVLAQMKQHGDHTWMGFSVKDSGYGISTEDQAHLFERFFRGKAAAATHAKGTGLGLSIAKEIVELHGGVIEVESEGILGNGSTFTVWLPVTDLGFDSG